MQESEFKKLIKTYFPKATFSKNTQGTQFDAGGLILRAVINVGWGYEMPESVEKHIKSFGIKSLSVNSKLRLTLLTD